MVPPLKYRPLRAPRQNGGVLVEPDWPSCVTLPLANAKSLSSWQFDLDGESSQAWRREARASVLKLAADYTSQYSDCETPQSSAPIILSGHQPQLFHPGVWAKNFAADRLARQVGGVAVHIIIDNDLCRDHGIRVPTGGTTSPQIVTEPFDHFDVPLPYEDRRVRDAEVFRSFSRRVADRLAPFVSEPLLPSIWPEAISAAANRPLGWAIAQARHRLERSWGLRSLEVPLSQICETTSFRQFVIHLLVRADEVRESHNRHLAEYRRVHRLRSAAQPIPDLRQSTEWTETPFWMWTSSDPRRRPLWCRRTRDGLQIGDQATENWSLEKAEHDAEEASNQLRDLSQRGLRIRPRALSNTLFARLVFGDLFIHGIGGAKYDQITDLWMADLFSIEPPPYATLSLTLHLPVDHRSSGPSEVVELQGVLREMHFHPERFLSTEELRNAQVSRWVDAKTSWIRRDLPRGKRLDRHRGISEANAELRQFLREKRENSEKQLAQLRSQMAACKVLEWREWPFCIFPGDFLRERLLDLAIPSP